MIVYAVLIVMVFIVCPISFRIPILPLAMNHRFDGTFVIPLGRGVLDTPAIAGMQDRAML